MQGMEMGCVPEKPEDSQRPEFEELLEEEEVDSADDVNDRDYLPRWGVK